MESPRKSRRCYCRNPPPLPGPSLEHPCRSSESAATATTSSQDITAVYCIYSISLCLMLIQSYFTISIFIMSLNLHAYHIAQYGLHLPSPAFTCLCLPASLQPARTQQVCCILYLYPSISPSATTISIV
jgi:hypothetical protein